MRRFVAGLAVLGCAAAGQLCAQAVTTHAQGVISPPQGSAVTVCGSQTPTATPSSAVSCITGLGSASGSAAVVSSTISAVSTADANLATESQAGTRSYADAGGTLMGVFQYTGSGTPTSAVFHFALSEATTPGTWLSDAWINMHVFQADGFGDAAAEWQTEYYQYISPNPLNTYYGFVADPTGYSLGVSIVPGAGDLFFRALIETTSSVTAAGQSSHSSASFSLDGVTYRDANGNDIGSAYTFTPLASLPSSAPEPPLFTMLAPPLLLLVPSMRRRRRTE